MRFPDCSRYSRCLAIAADADMDFDCDRCRFFEPADLPFSPEEFMAALSLIIAALYPEAWSQCNGAETLKDAIWHDIRAAQDERFFGINMDYSRLLEAEERG